LKFFVTTACEGLSEPEFIHFLHLEILLVKIPPKVADSAGFGDGFYTLFAFEKIISKNPLTTETTSVII